MPEPTQIASGFLTFKVDARHIHQLGMELVENQVTAVSELIKNAYDADATRVVVGGYGTQAPGGVIVVADNGVGMSLEDAQRGWMRLASSNKETEPLSPKYGRVRAGRKGIGRFAAQRIGDRLDLESVSASTSERLTIGFDWDSDYVTGADLEAVTNAYTIADAPPRRSGTALVIRGVRQAWGPAEWNKVLDAVRLLRPPFPVKPVDEPGQVDTVDPGFSVQVLAPAALADVPADPLLALIDGPSPAAARDAELDDFLSAATADVSGSVDESGHLSWVVRYRETSDVDEMGGRKLFTAIGPIKFQLYYFIYRSDALGDVKVRVAQEMGRRFGGIRLYRDDLRVMPYGEPDDDWLGQNEMQAARVVLPPVGTINYFGAVLIGRASNPDLVDTSAREGIVEGPALQELRQALREVIVGAAERVASRRQRKSRAGSPVPEAQSRQDTVAQAVSQFSDLISSSAGPQAIGQDLDALAKTLSEVAREQDELERARTEALLGELQLLRILASLGTASSVFSHEVSGALHRARSSLGDARVALGVADVEGMAALPSILDELEASLQSLSELADYLGAYSSTSRRRELRPQALSSVIEAFVGAFERMVSQRSITITRMVAPRSLRTHPMARSELEAILFNLLSNSVKALDHAGLDDRRIEVRAAPGEGAFVSVQFSDSGVGVPASIRDRIFDAFVSGTSSYGSELGAGSGLGLKVVRDLVESHGGEVVLLETPREGFTTTFEVRLPRLEGQLLNDRVGGSE